MAALDGSTSGAISDPWRGTLVGKYELLTLLSAGGMAELFLAYTQGPGGFRKYVVLKRILPEARDNEQFVKMFLDEARITAAFNHPNIAQVYDLGDDQDGLYLAMEFIGGQNLNQVTNGCARARAVMPLGFSASVVHDCALALHYAHTFRDPTGREYPVIHRDVAQKNIMVTYEGLVKLLDFGIAKARGSLGKTHAGAVKGTAGYMSPEQVRGEPLDGRSDVFSLGVVLYEMITGRRLFAANTETEEMRMILDAPIVRPSEVFAVIPEELSDVAMRALAREKADRFASGKEMAKALSASCGHLLFDQEQRAVFMRELFEEKMIAAQQLLESAGGESDRSALLEQAAYAIREDPGQYIATQMAAKKMGKPQLAAAKKKKKKAEAVKAVDDKLEEVKAKAGAMAYAEEAGDGPKKPVIPEPETPPEKSEGGGLVLPLLLLVALGAGGFGIYQIVFATEEQPQTPAYQSDVPIPGYDPNKEQQANLPTPGDANKETKDSKDAKTGKDGKESKESKDGKEPKAAAAGKGTLTLFTIPAGAKVLLKGKELGKTPLLNQPMPAGEHLLVLQFPDGKKKKFSAQVEANKLAKFKLTEEDLPAD
jgi:eukaryotic-like serine/threonine-protein kinase